MKAMIAKHGRRRVFLAGLCVFSVVLIAEMIALCVIYNTVWYKGQALKVREVTSDSVVTTDRDGNEMTMTVEKDAGNTWNTGKTILYKTETIHYRYEAGEGSVYKFSDGYTYAEPMVQMSYDSDERLNEMHKAEKKLLDKLSNYSYSYKKTAIFAVISVLGLCLLALSLGIFFYPETFWRMQTFLIVDGGEPTDYYIFVSKATSVVCAAIVYIGAIVFTFAV